MNSLGRNATDLQRIAVLYVPLSAAVIAGLLRRGRPRLFAACLLSTLWVAPMLVALQALNQWAGWWTFSTEGLGIRGLSLECLVGWIILWGVLPQLVFPRLSLGWVLCIFLAVDLIVMPICGQIIQLGTRWLIGEAAAVLIFLIPALCLARWTFEDTHLKVRAALQVATSGLIFLYLVPEIVFALKPGAGWQPLLQMNSWMRQAGLQLLFVCALPGISAVMEFAGRGLGTPIPYDPPKRLVTSGIYRYCANPMQLSCAVVMLLWALLLRNLWLVFAAATSVFYSSGIAWWHEGQDLAGRFGDDWRRYRAEVRNWRFRWRPYHAANDAHIYIAKSCSPCSELRLWIEARRPVGLKLVDAEEFPSESMERMRYDPRDGTPAVDGVRALARVFEHLNLGWALAGAFLRLPLVWQFVQLLMDASGLGPRRLEACEACGMSSKDAVPLNRSGRV